MWKPSSPPLLATDPNREFGAIIPTSSPNRGEALRPNTSADTNQQATVGKALVIKGEVTGSEPLYIEGRVEGIISLPNSRVTVGRSGVVSANINAHEIIIIGKVRGNLIASDRVDIRSDGSLVGDVVAARISIEDGAFFKGGIDIRTAARIAEDSGKQAALTIGFDAHLSAEATGLTLRALADYYRACGGIGFQVDLHAEVTLAEDATRELRETR